MAVQILKTMGIHEAFAIRMNAARQTEAMLDRVIAKALGAGIFFRSQKVQLVPWHKPQ